MWDQLKPEEGRTREASLLSLWPPPIPPDFSGTSCELGERGPCGDAGAEAAVTLAGARAGVHGVGAAVLRSVDPVGLLRGPLAMFHVHRLIIAPSCAGEMTPV